MHRLRTWQLFAVCVLLWGTTWHAITYQVSDFPPELGVDRPIYRSCSVRLLE